jgi:hypothetical protein
MYVITKFYLKQLTINRKAIMSKKILLLAFLIVGLSSCTENTRAKSFGGSMVIDLPNGTKLVTATWKVGEDGKQGPSLWYLYTSMDSTDTPKTYTFKEKSDFGLVEGVVYFTEGR